MTEEQVAALVKQELEKRGATDPDMAPAIAKALSGPRRCGPKSTTHSRSATSERSHGQAAREAEQKRAEHEATVEARVDALTRFRSLLPTDFDHKGKSVKDILVAAAGDEVKDAEKRSEDYLLAKVEGILERRGDGSGGLKNRADDASATGDPIGLRGIYNLRKVS